MCQVGGRTPLKIPPATIGMGRLAHGCKGLAPQPRCGDLLPACTTAGAQHGDLASALCPELEHQHLWRAEVKRHLEGDHAVPLERPVGLKD